MTDAVLACSARLHPGLGLGIERTVTGLGGTLIRVGYRRR
jgi:hypothetical protein